MRTIGLGVFVMLLAGSAYSAEYFKLAENARTEYTIITPAKPSPPESLAARELARYLAKISGAKFEVRKASSRLPKHAIVVANRGSLGERASFIASLQPASEGYVIAAEDGRLFIVGGRDRATLNAVYSFLHKLGCRWLAPNFDHYAGTAEYIPQKSLVEFTAEDIYSQNPMLSIRKLYVEEGHSHNAHNLIQLVEWMSKAGFNTLVIPTDYQGGGRVKWDNWRQRIAPELQKRDITIEVGGHGYQNFLNAEMEDGKLFDRHPEWFGQDEEGTRRGEHRYVFCTSNADAVNYLTANFVKYLEGRPEIQIFDFWPPDGAKWCECDTCKALGSPSDRQAILLSQVEAEVAKARPDVRLECIAYAKAIAPPESAVMDKNVLVDFCPIRQCFEYQIFDRRSPINADYVANLRAWLKDFDGDISIYSYYRKYAWKSLPVIIPHYMQEDLKFYLNEGVRGISSYAEPGDWFTYELNHYVLARLAWDPSADVNAIVAEFCEARYGPAHHAAAMALMALERTTRRFSSIPGTSLKPADEIARRRAELQDHVEQVRAELSETDDPGTAHNLKRLLLVLEYALRDLEIQEQRAGGGADDARKLVGDLTSFLSKHASAGVFLVGRLEPRRLLRSYSIEN